MSAALPAAELDATTRRLLDLMQDHFPLVERPYEALGEQLGISEQEALRLLGQARNTGVIRQICAIYDSRALGYSSALVAMHIQPEHLERAVRVLNAHPGVSHNYLRNHEFNVWFTIAMPPGTDLSEVVQRLHELARAESTRPMPTLHLFKIAVSLDMSGDRAADERSAPEYTQERRERAADYGISERDIAFIRATQGDLPDVAEPFAALGASIDMTGAEVVAHGARMIERGQMRRFAGIINHRRAGFRANGMAVWAVPPDRIRAFGDLVAGYRNVSHCYQRPTYPDWPYSVFSMLHSGTVAGVEEVAAAISRDTGVTDFGILFSTTEYKKVRLMYFIPEYEQWEALCSAAAEEPA